jgi:hypothetical protein
VASKEYLFEFNLGTGGSMDSRKHLYYITVSDVQAIAKETIGRLLDEKELQRVYHKFLDRIEWYEHIERTILDEINI